MQRDGVIVVVDAPEFLEQHLGLRARVDEDEAGAVAADQVVDLRQGVARHVTRPRQMLLGVEHRDLRLRAGFRR